MKYIKIAIALFTLSVIISACDKNFLERYPLDQVNSAVFLLQPNDMKIYMNQFYSDGLFPVFWGNVGGAPYRNVGVDDFDSDNQYDNGRINDRLQGTRTASAAGDWNFGSVRSINFFFDNYKKCTADFSAYKQYVGEAHFFRALIYFSLLQHYGDVPWFQKTLGTNSPELYGERTPRNIVADNIIADLDSAALYLSEDKTNGFSRLNKWIALTLQTRVALYEGTWEKYHNGDPFGVTGATPNKYLNKVVEAASVVMNSGKYSIYNTGHPATDYFDLFKMRDYSTNTEVLFWKKYSSALQINNNRLYRLEYPFGRSITKQLADSYLCTDGKPISVSPLFLGNNRLSVEMQNRDPRFAQTIFTPDAQWMISATNVVTLWDNCYKSLNTGNNLQASTGYVLRKTYDPVMSYHNSNNEESPAIHYRYAEILLDYAEAKAELGSLTQADLDNSINKLRGRVGMPDLIIADITTDPKWDFPTLSPVINEIRRERRVELATEGFRWPDIARWAAADELIIEKRPKGFLASQLTASGTFPVDENGFLDPIKNALPAGYGFKADRDYLDPISLNQIDLNPQLVQNPGW